MLAAQDLRLVLEEQVGDVVCVARHRRGQALAASFTLPRLPQELGGRRRRPKRSPRASASRRPTSASARIGRVVYGAGRPTSSSRRLPSAEALARADPDVGRWGADNGPAIYCYTPGDDGVDYRARMFASGWGIREDPATGSAAAAFAGVVMRFAPPGDGEQTLVIAQGVEMGRPSRIALGLDVERGALQRGDDRRLGGAGRRGNDRPVSASRILSSRRARPCVRRAPWPFAEAEADRIADHWRARVAQPAAALQRPRAAARTPRARRRPDGGSTLARRIFRDRFRRFSRLARLRLSRRRGRQRLFDGGAASAPTAPSCSARWRPTPPTPARSTFPPARPTRSDVFDGKVDLAASALRELEEETGIAADAVAFDPGWTVVYAPPRIACMKIMRLAEPAEAVKARVEAFLAADADAELARDARRARTGRRRPRPRAGLHRRFFRLRLRSQIGGIAVALARGDDRRARLRFVAGGALRVGFGDFFLDLVVDRLDDVAHRQIVVHDRAIAGDVAGAAFAARHPEIIRRHFGRGRRGRGGLRRGGRSVASRKRERGESGQQQGSHRISPAERVGSPETGQSAARVKSKTRRRRP